MGVREVIETVLREQGLDLDAGFHSWRCAYPDRYAPCTCVADLTTELMRSLVDMPAIDLIDLFTLSPPSAPEQLDVWDDQGRVQVSFSAREASVQLETYGGSVWLDSAEAGRLAMQVWALATRASTSYEPEH